jgi:hypothetical protein
MKKAVLILLMSLPMTLAAQQAVSDAAPSGTAPNSVTFPIEKVQTPTAADLNCAGYIGKPIEAKDRFVTGGLDSPFTTHYGIGEEIFLNGKGYEAGQEFEIVRALRDPNRYEIYPGQWAAVKAAGWPYAELGRVKVVDTRSRMAVAHIEYSCSAILPGDFAIPYVEKTAIAFHPPMRFDRFAPANGQVSGRIVLGKDFDSELGNGGKVYLNIGSNQGLKVGDFLRAERSYEATRRDAVDSLSFEARTMEPTQREQPSMGGSFLQSGSYTFGPAPRGQEIHISEMPRRGVGEIVVLQTTPTTATGMIVFSVEPVYVGDRVELDQQ